MQFANPILRFDTCDMFVNVAMVTLGVEDTDLADSGAQRNLCKMVVDWVEMAMLHDSLDEVLQTVSLLRH